MGPGMPYGSIVKTGRPRNIKHIFILVLAIMDG
jgi:hypothetical protein